MRAGFVSLMARHVKLRQQQMPPGSIGRRRLAGCNLLRQLLAAIGAAGPIDEQLANPTPLDQLSGLRHVIECDLHGKSGGENERDRKSTRLNSSHSQISYAGFCLKKKNHSTDMSLNGSL